MRCTRFLPCSRDEFLSPLNVSWSTHDVICQLRKHSLALFLGEWAHYDVSDRTQVTVMLSGREAQEGLKCVRLCSGFLTSAAKKLWIGLPDLMTTCEIDTRFMGACVQRASRLWLRHSFAISHHHPSPMAPSKLEQGHGRVVVHNDGHANVFSEMSAMYPLKLLSPQLPSPNVSIVYMLSYGGGLVGGDWVKLEVEVHDGARLAILSQVSMSQGECDQLFTALSNLRGLRRCSKPDPDNVYLPARNFTLSPLRN